MRLRNTRKHAPSAGFFDGLIVDEFAGGGGASLGIELATGRAVDLAVNHCPQAIAMHTANHPHTRHECQSVWDVDPIEATGGKPVDVAWFSPDCKHFSKAKGGKPVSKKIRGLAWIIVKWAGKTLPKMIYFENVSEFTTWGPLIAKRCAKTGRVMKMDGTIAAPGEQVRLQDQCLIPNPKRKGKIFKAWKAALRSLGYNVEFRELAACDYGVPTIRKRLYGIARRDGKPIVWPERTHGDPKKLDLKALGLKPWRPAADIIDRKLKCPSIFTRPRPLKSATLKRIAAGTKRYVIEAEKPFTYEVDDADPFIAEYHSTKPGGDERVRPVDQPLPTQTCENRFGLVVPTIVNVTHTQAATGSKPIDEPLQTITTAKGGEKAVVAAHITKFRNGSDGAPLDEPLATVTANSFIKRPGGAAPIGIVAATLIQTGYGEREGQEPRALDPEKPLGTVVGSNKHGLVAATIVNVTHQGEGQAAPADEPLRTITSFNRGEKALSACFLAQHNSERNGAAKAGRPADAPVSTITSTGSHQSLVVGHLAGVGGRAGQSRPRGIDEPTATTTAKADTAFVAAHLTKLYGTSESGSPIDEPAPTVTATGQHIGYVASHLSHMYGQSVGSAADEPTRSQSGCNHQAHIAAFLQKYYGNEKDGVSLDEPMHTIPTKDRFGYVATVLAKAPQTFPDGFYRVWQFLVDHLGPDAPPPVVWIKGEMFVIVDIGMRMLTPRELARAQGFPDSYILTGTKTNQVARIGNSVCPEMARVIVAANYTDRPVTSSSRRVA
jgi:DNA (cytosine-5)-methyltransferase 1